MALGEQPPPGREFAYYQWWRGGDTLTAEVRLRDAFAGELPR